MKRLLGALLALLLAAALAGCGDEVARPQGSGSPSPTGSGTGGSGTDELVAILTGTSAGGAVDPVAVPLDSAAAVDGFVAQFPRGELPGEIRTWVAKTDVPAGRQLVAAVVAIGCQVPVDVEVTHTSRGVLVEGVASGKSPEECFAAMTSVALVLVTP